MQPRLLINTILLFPIGSKLTLDLTNSVCQTTKCTYFSVGGETLLPLGSTFDLPLSTVLTTAVPLPQIQGFTYDINSILAARFEVEILDGQEKVVFLVSGYVLSECDYLRYITPNKLSCHPDSKCHTPELISGSPPQGFCECLPFERKDVLMANNGSFDFYPKCDPDSTIEIEEFSFHASSNLPTKRVAFDSVVGHIPIYPGQRFTLSSNLGSSSVLASGQYAVYWKWDSKLSGETIRIGSVVEFSIGSLHFTLNSVSASAATIIYSSYLQFQDSNGVEVIRIRMPDVHFMSKCVYVWNYFDPDGSCISSGLINSSCNPEASLGSSCNPMTNCPFSPIGITSISVTETQTPVQFAFQVPSQFNIATGLSAVAHLPLLDPLKALVGTSQSTVQNVGQTVYFDATFDVIFPPTVVDFIVWVSDVNYGYVGCQITFTTNFPEEPICSDPSFQLQTTGLFPFEPWFNLELVSSPHQKITIPHHFRSLITSSLGGSAHVQRQKTTHFLPGDIFSTKISTMPQIHNFFTTQETYLAVTPYIVTQADAPYTLHSCLTSLQFQLDSAQFPTIEPITRQSDGKSTVLINLFNTGTFSSISGIYIVSVATGELIPATLNQNYVPNLTKGVYGLRPTAQLTAGLYHIELVVHDPPFAAAIATAQRFEVVDMCPAIHIAVTNNQPFFLKTRKFGLTLPLLPLGSITSITFHKQSDSSTLITPTGLTQTNLEDSTLIEVTFNQGVIFSLRPYRFTIQHHSTINAAFPCQSVFDVEIESMCDYAHSTIPPPRLPTPTSIADWLPNRLIFAQFRKYVPHFLDHEVTSYAWYDSQLNKLIDFAVLRVTSPAPQGVAFRVSIDTQNPSFKELKSATVTPRVILRAGDEICTVTAESFLLRQSFPSLDFGIGFVESRIRSDISGYPQNLRILEADEEGISDYLATHLQLDPVFQKRADFTLSTTPFPSGSQVEVGIQYYPLIGDNVYSTVPIEMSIAQVTPPPQITSPQIMSLQITINQHIIHSNRAQFYFKYPRLSDQVEAKLTTQIFTILSPTCYIEPLMSTTTPLSAWNSVCQPHESCSLQGECSDWAEIIVDDDIQDNTKLSCDICNSLQTESCDRASPKCLCRLGFNGDRCEKPTKCEQNSGKCKTNGFVDLVADTCDTKCTCYNFFVGETCDECSLKCYNNGIRYKDCDRCGCTTGFAGNNCQCESSIGSLKIYGYSPILLSYEQLIYNITVLKQTNVPNHIQSVMFTDSQSLKDQLIEAISAIIGSTSSSSIKINSSHQKNPQYITNNNNDKTNDQDEITSHFTTISITTLHNCQEHNTNVNQDQLTSKFASLPTEVLKTALIKQHFIFSKNAEPSADVGDLEPTDSTLPQPGEELKEVNISFQNPFATFVTLLIIFALLF